MKKFLALTVTAFVIFASAAAFAQPRNAQSQAQVNRPRLSQSQAGPKNFQSCNPGDGEFDGRFKRPGAHPGYGYCGGGRRHMNFTPDMPSEIREKAAELAKLRIDLEEAMSSKPVNKAKALDTFAKIQKVEQEIDAWRFAQKLERIEEFRKHRELNKKIPPARPTPVKPEPQPQDSAKDAPEK